jgi:3-isopropylmalate/(R)-2-methylmalate dehydratase large subunit
MLQTATEKILSRAMGHTVRQGEIIYPEPDLITVHDWYVVNFDKALQELGVSKLYAPDKLLLCTDHEPVAVSVLAAERQRQVRQIVAKYGIKHFYDTGRGGHGHVFPMELGYIKPGMFVLAYDVHVNNYGALGCLAIPLVIEITDVLACGSVWLKVPETLRINLTGSIRPGITTRDIADRMIADVGADMADYTVMEFGGPALSSIGIDGRITLCNRPIEIGVKSTIFETDAVTFEYLKGRVPPPYEEVRSDPGAKFKATLDYDLGILEPQVAAPPTPDNVVPVSQVAGKKIDHAFIGSCANCSITDLRDAARILKDRKIAPGVRFVVTPGTQQIATQAAAEGLLQIFTDAGAMLTAPGCGPCAGGRTFPIAKGETSINTGTRNDYGRLGTREAEIYLGSPFTVAASAVAGKIVDPREFL